MSFAQDVEVHREEILSRMVQHLREEPNRPESEVRQFLIGFLHVIMEASEGRPEAGDEYLDLIAPACKQNGIALDYIVESNAVVGMVLVAVLDKKHHDFVIDFCGRWAMRWVLRWETA